MKLKNLFFGLTAAFMATACSSNDDPGNGNVQEGLQLNSSEAYILNNGQEETLFTVTMEGADVAAQSTIYQKVNGKSEVYEGLSFKSSEAGKYVFFASYQGKLTPEITIEAVKEKLQLPEDTDSDKYDGFRKRVLVTEGTSLDCNICPKMIVGINEFSKLNTNGDAVLTVVHGVKGEDEFFTPSTDVVALQLFTRGNVGGVPSTVLNLKADEGIGVYATDTPETIANTIKKAVDSEMQSEASCAISAATSGDATKGISVSAKVKVNKAGRYRMAVWVIEDNLVSSEKQIGTTPELDAMYDFSKHNHLVRYVSATEPIFGDIMAGKDTSKGNEVLEFHHCIEQGAFKFADMQNVKVVLIVSRAGENSSNFVTDNVVECPLNQSITFEYK